MRAETGVLIGGVIGLIVGAAVSQRWGSDVGAVVTSVPQPVATIIAAVLGFGVIAWQARLSVKSIIAGQNHRAALEAQARLDQDRLNRDGIERDRQHEKKVLAAALHGELFALLKSVHNSGTALRMQAAIWKHVGEDRSYDLPNVDVSLPTYRVPVYESNVGRIGLLGASLAADVATVFSKATVTNPSPLAKVTPKYAAIIAEAAHAASAEWGWEILQVGARLAHVHLGTPDPGPLSDAVASKRYRESAPNGA